MKIQTNLLRAASKFQAKDDIRYYLNGIHLNKGKIEATNGHVAIILDTGEKNKVDKIIKFIGSIPKKAEFTEIVFDEKCNIAIHSDEKGNKIGAQIFDIVDGRFPDVNNIVPKQIKKEKFPAIQTIYLELINKAFEASARNFVAVKPVHYCEGEAVLFELTGGAKDKFNNPIVLIMGSRD